MPRTQHVHVPEMPSAMPVLVCHVSRFLHTFIPYLLYLVCPITSRAFCSTCSGESSALVPYVLLAPCALRASNTNINFYAHAFPCLMWLFLNLFQTRELFWEILLQLK